MAGKILVLGATGTVGSELVARLEERGERVRAATRNPSEAARTESGSTEYVRFDLEQPETFGPALDGVDRVFLIARPGDEQADRVALPLIAELRRRGVRRVVNLSALGAETRDDFSLRKVERALEDSGIAFTHLRPNFFMQVFSSGPLFAGLRATGELRIPAGLAAISYIDARDIAAVAAVALTSPGHEGKAYALTGDRALDHDEVAAVIAEAAGRPVRYVPLDEDAARAALLAAGLSSERVERLIGFYRIVRDGRCALISPALRALLGRPAIPFPQFARDFARVWR